MKMPDIRKKAKTLGVRATLMAKKSDLIRAIQKAEGNTPCFGTGDKTCPYTDCCWRGDCIPAS